MSLSIVADPLRAVSPHFQRSINLSYDAGDADYIAGYIPTPNGASALANIFANTRANASQRAHVLHAAYGSGKSLLGLVLSALASHDPVCSDALSIVQNRLMRTFPEQAEHICTYRNSGTRLLPVILSGDEGYLSTALTHALSRALIQKGLNHLQPRTQFQAALEMIHLWEQNYPDAYQRLQTKLSLVEKSLDELTHNLKALEPNALILFERLYPEITSGAHFDPYTGPTLDSVFHATAEALHDVGYAGIIVIWDEFGRFLDNRVEDAFGAEAALLQSFAEFCNRSGPHQVHLVLITHRILSGYAAGLPQTYQQEWARIAERFSVHDVSSDPVVTYRLISEALQIPNPEAWRVFTEQHHSEFDQLTAYTLELSLFDTLDDVALRQQTVEGAWPLHPLAVFALPRLASRIAQNERTLFTFLAADEPYTLAEQLATSEDKSSWWFTGLDTIWDYFAEAIRSSIGSGGTHLIWSGAMYALSKVAPNDVLAESLIKTLGILLIVGEVNIQSQLHFGRVIPTTELLAWAVGAPEEVVANRLEVLSNRRVIVLRRSDGYWTFARGSDVDIDGEVSTALERRSPSRLQIRQILENTLPAPFHLPRSYNLKQCMTRFFWGLYRWPEEISSVCTETFLKQLGTHGYADGAIIYVLTTNSVEREQAITAIRKLSSRRVVFVIPDQPLLILEPIRELSALSDLSSNIVFMQQDERLQNELSFFIEDTQRRLARTMRPSLEPNQERSTWWWHDGSVWCSDRLKATQISPLLSQLCNLWFDETPILNNELLNYHNPTGQQVRAAEKIIDILLSQPHDALPDDLNVSGHGPDWLIVRTLLIRTNLIHPTATGFWCLRRPANNPLLAQIWDIVQEFLNTATENEQNIETLIDKLQSPPYGLRRGLLPILLAAMIRLRLPVLTIRQNRKVISPITGPILTMMCQQPDHYTIEVGPWDARREALWAVLEERLQGFLVEQEHVQQPLSTLSLGLLRWLQSQPRYCRDTNQISLAAQRLRDLIRKAQREPARALFYELLELLDDGSIDPNDKNAYKQALADHLSRLTDEITTAYQALLYSLDCFAEETFVSASSSLRPNGQMAIRSWLEAIEQRLDTELKTFRFSDQLAQRLVQTVHHDLASQDGRFWDHLSKAVLGIALHDWNDRSGEVFRRNLLDIKERVEHEVFELAKDESVVKLSVSLPDQEEQIYRFRPSDLSPQGQRILQNFKSTLEIAGRPLPPDERRQVVLALLHFVLEGLNQNDQ